MSLIEAIEKGGRFSPLSVPELRYLSAAADRVRERWPDVQMTKTEQEREALAQKLRERVERDDWGGTRLSFVVTAASAVFDSERWDRPDLARTREFIYAEIAASTSETLLSGLLRAYLDSYSPQAPHTTALVTAVIAAIPQMSPSVRLLLDAVPELLDPKTGPDRLAARMSEMSDPYTELLRLGVRNPHGGGFMDLAHLSLTSRVRSHLSGRTLIDWYISWLRPLDKEEARTTGAEPAIEALIHPWLKNTPDDELRSYLVETLIELYGDPRIKSGGVWSGIDDRYMAIVQRWLTREDMRFFTGVVDAVQKDNMWVKRRDFWLKLYDEGLIDAAWAALSSEGFEYARQHLMRQDAKNAYTRVGFQRARKNTSLLIMKIGNKIMVDGCHNYKTHVFEASDPMAPKLYEEGYDCASIMAASDDRRSVSSKSHSSIDSWGRWVRDMINADVDWSQRKRPYPKVLRPRPPSSSNVYSPRRPVGNYASVITGSSGIDQNRERSGVFNVDGSNRAQQNVSTATFKPSRTPIQSRPTASVSKDQSLQVKIPQQQNSIYKASSQKEKFSSLTDLMGWYGPDAASAVLNFLEDSGENETTVRLSPTSREGLEWIIEQKGELPFKLRNSLEWLLINLKRGGVDMDDLFARSAFIIPDMFEGLPSAQTTASIDSNSVLASTKSLTATRFPSFTDRMIAYGPGAAAAVIAFLEAPSDIQSRPLLSPKSREALAWVRAVKQDLPLNLRNALEYLLINLKESGVDLDDLFSTNAGPSELAQARNRPNPIQQTVAGTSPEKNSERYPLMSKTSEGRLAHLMKHVDALEEMGMKQGEFEQRKAAVTMVNALRERPSDLLPSQIMDLMSLYDQLRKMELDELPASSAAAVSASAQPAPAPKRAPVSEVHKFPPLPDHSDGRLDLLCEHLDALEDLGMWKRTFEQRKAFAIAVRKLKERSSDLRPTEIADLQSLYEELRQGGKDKRK